MFPVVRLFERGNGDETPPAPAVRGGHRKVTAAVTFGDPIEPICARCRAA